MTLNCFPGLYTPMGDTDLAFRRDPTFIAGHKAYDGVGVIPIGVSSGIGSLDFKNDTVGLYAGFSDFLFEIPKVAAEWDQCQSYSDGDEGYKYGSHCFGNSDLVTGKDTIKWVPVTLISRKVILINIFLLLNFISFGLLIPQVKWKKKKPLPI